MECPVCELSENLANVNNTHYICSTENCYPYGYPETRTQFRSIVDNEIKFPQNIIFSNRSRSEFYKKKYIEPENFDF